MAAEIASVDNQVLVWCDLNAESEALGKKIADAIEIKGADSNEFKEEQMNRFTVSDLRCLVSKPSISGWGMNWQGCHEMIFVGLSDSFEAYYQAVRKCWRFGQEHPVTVHIVVSEQEGAVKQNIERKQEDAMRLMRELVKHTQKILSEEVHQTKRISESYYAFTPIQLPNWLKEEA